MNGFILCLLTLEWFYIMSLTHEWFYMMSLTYEWFYIMALQGIKSCRLHTYKIRFDCPQYVF